MSDNTDRRIQRTQRLLAQSLITLTFEKGYAAVSIRDITEHAGIGYATFFRHHADKEALLSDVLKVFLEALIERLQPGPVGKKSSAAMAAEGRLLFTYLRDHHELCRLLLASHSLSSLIWQIHQSYTQPLLGEQAYGEVVPLQVLEHHIIGATIVLIQWWFAHDMPYEPERMGQIYATMIIQPAQSLLTEAV